MEKLADKNNQGNGEIIQKLPSRPIHEGSYKNLSSLDLNNPSKYRLLDLDQLDSKDYRKVYMNITYLDVSRNTISSLKLKGYSSLETIISCDNSITRVELNLPRLKKLNLNDNMITKIIDLNSIPLLEELMMNKNAIKTISFEDLRSVKNNLCVLELAQNRIEFSSVNEFLDVFEQFGKYMKKLKTLNIGNNSFNSPQNKIYREYADYIIFQCTFLKIMNGKMIDNNYRQDIRIGYIKQKMLKNEKDEGPKTFKAIDKSNDNKYKGAVTLTTINKEMELYSQHGKLNKSSFKELKQLLDMYLLSTKIEHQNEEDSMKLEDPELDEFETFLELCNILTDATPSIDKSLNEVIAQFVIIKNGKFSYRALSFLQQRVNPEKIKDIEEILDNFVIKHTCKTSEENMSPAIFKGLEPFIAELRFQNLFKKLIEKLIEVLKEFNKIKLLNTKTSEENRKKELYLSVVSFLSCACNNFEHLILMVNNSDFIDIISGRIKSLLNEGDDVISTDGKTMEILQKLLIIVRSLCMINLTDEIAYSMANSNIKKLVGSGLRDKIEQSLNAKIQDMASKKDEENNMDNSLKEVFYNKKLIFANLMRCYGSLLYRTDNISKLVENKQSIPMKIINLLVQTEMNDPIIIAAASGFTLYFLSNKQMKKNDDNIFGKTTKNLYNLRFLMPYLFQYKNEFKNACIIADKYGQNTIVRGKPVELAVMNSEIMNDLIISIVNLIGFFGENSKKESKIRKICQDICLDLNDQKRDFALCSCLSISNEIVKLAVVECLYAMDCKQFSAEEIFYIWKQMANINFTGGKIERIITIIFIILNKCFLYYLKQGKFEVIEQNKDVFSLAFDIILKNEERNALYELENLPKALLSIAIVIFLYNCSCFEQLKKVFLEDKNTMKIPKILYSEELFREKNFNLPVEIEKTRTGCNIENLIECFKHDYRSLTPYSYISLRILIHIADVLMGVPFPIFEINDFDESEKVLEDIRKELVKRESERIIYESKSFRKFVEDKLENPREKSKHFIQLSKQDLKEQQQSFLKNFPLLLNFMTGESIQKYISNFSVIFKDKFDPEFDKISFSTSAKINNNEDEEFLLGGEIDDEMNIYKEFKRQLREEEYSPLEKQKESTTCYDHIMNDLIKYSKYGFDEETLRRLEEEETPNNPYIRSLFIAAFLRSIYALLEFPVDNSIKDQMIAILYKDNNIKRISKLTDCTKLIDNSVSSKYLIIMRHVLMNSKIFFDKKNIVEDYNVYLTNVGIIAYMIRKMVKIFKKVIKIDDDEHKILIAEISKICSIIISEMQNIKFDDKVKEKTLETMISYEVITVLIQVIKEYMNRESKSFKDKIEKDDDDENAGPANDIILNEMVSNISYIIGEYMSKCKKHSYNILENFTRSYIFEKVKMRQSYLKEIMNYSKLSDLKIKISNEKNVKVDYITRVHITDYNLNKSRLKLMILTKTALEFLDVKDPANEYSDWQLNDFDIDKNMSIPIEDIEALICLELDNRMLIKTTKNHYGMFFYKMHSASLLLPLLKISNSRITIYENVPIFLGNDLIAKKIQEEENKLTPLYDVNVIKNNGIYNTIKEETDEGSPDPVTIKIEAEKENEKEEEKDNNNKSDRVVIYCVSIVKRFFDFIAKMFQKVQIIPNGKIVVITESKLIIYEEDTEQWNNFNVKLLFERALKNNPRKGIFLGNFLNCFNFLTDYDLSELGEFTTSNVDNLKLKFKSGEELNITTLDDLSFVKFKKAIYPYLKKNKMNLLDDGYYDYIK